MLICFINCLARGILRGGGESSFILLHVYMPHFIYIYIYKAIKTAVDRHSVPKSFPFLDYVLPVPMSMREVVSNDKRMS